MAKAILIILGCVYFFGLGYRIKGRLLRREILTILDEINLEVQSTDMVIRQLKTPPMIPTAVHLKEKVTLLKRVYRQNEI